MAHLENIWVYDPNDKEPYMSVKVAMKPHGTVSIKVSLPDNFLKAIIDIAQTAADAHEALARAEILGDQPRTRDTVHNTKESI